MDDWGAIWEAYRVSRILVVDNYDSFVYNLVHYLGELGDAPRDHRHDAIDNRGVEDKHP